MLCPLFVNKLEGIGDLPITQLKDFQDNEVTDLVTERQREQFATKQRTTL